MGHRHLFNSSEIVDTAADQGWNHDEQAYMNLARDNLPEGNTFVSPAENTVAVGVTFASQWIPGPRAVGYSAAGLNVGIPHYQPQAPAPAPDPFMHPSAAGSFHMVQENHAHHASSSHHGGQTFHGVDGGGFDFTMGNMRGPHKRKSPSVPAVCDRGSTSQYYDAGSSSGISMPIDKWQEKQILDSHPTPWNVPPSFRGGHSFTIRSEDAQRNVRSRTSYDLEANITRTHLSINPSHNAITSLPTDHSSQAGIWGQSSSEWNRSPVIPTAHSRNLIPETNVFGHGMNHFNVVSGTSSAAPLEIGGYQNNYSSNQNPISQNLQGNLNQSARGVRSSYTQRSSPTFRASSSNIQPGHGAASEEGLQAVGESYSSRHSRPFSTVVVCDRNGRSRISNDRYRSFPDEAVLHDRFPPEGVMIVDRSGLHGSRSLMDQHRDMRLDIDNMSYEELLALGERIGSVNTGLSDDLISKCLTESIFCSADQSQEEEKCVICLEEYKNMDDVASLKVCGHDFHVECIRKWLSMKNMCPICKAAAVDDKMKQS